MTLVTIALLVMVVVCAVALCRLEAREARDDRLAKALAAARFRGEQGDADWLTGVSR